MKTTLAGLIDNKRMQMEAPGNIVDIANIIGKILVIYHEN